MKYVKLIISCLIVLYASVSLVSAPLYMQAVDVVQPDGKVLSVFASGDEFYNWLHDKDGYTIIQDQKTGYYVYARLEGNKFVATSSIVGDGNTPAKLNISKWEKLPKEEIYKSALDMRQTQNMAKPQLKGFEKTQINNYGTINNIVIFIRFADESEFTDNVSVYDNMFNQQNSNSMFQYFRDVSYNTLDVPSTFYPIPTAGTVVSYQDTENRSYYQPYSTSNPNGYTGGDGGTMRRDREHILLKRAVEAVRNSIPTSLVIDNDNDGYVDNVCFIISGSTTGWSSLLWPHRWVLYSQNVTINGKRVWDFNFQIRSATLSSGNGVLCHEMFHSLGSPDLYHYTGNGISPVGSWDLMENNTNPPQSMGAYMKWKYGKWIASIPQITESGVYTLNPVTSSTNNCYKIASPYSTTEFFVVEYRKKEGLFENSIPGSGLLVYRINTAAGNGNASGPPDEVYIYRPNGTTSVNGTVSSANYSASAGRTAINDATNPSCFLANGSNGGLNLDLVSAPGATISFRVTFANQEFPVLLTPADNSTNVVLKPTLTWQQFTGATSYQLQVATSSDFLSPIINQSNLTNLYYTFANNLNENTNYYWRVKAFNGTTGSSWSPVFKFTTISSITITSVNGILCAGNPITLNYTVNGTFGAQNVFAAEISDSLGKFVYLNIIGLRGATGSGTIDCILPDTLPGGSKYRIRIKSSHPELTSPTNANDLRITPKLTPVIGNFKKDVCTNNFVTYFTSMVPGVSNRWTVSGGIVQGKLDSNTITVLWGDTGVGSIKLKQTSVSGCYDSTEYEILIKGLPTPQITSGASSVCLNSNEVYSANTGNGIKNQWFIQGGVINQLLPNERVRINWTKSGNNKITLYQWNSTGCLDSISLNVVVNDAPTATIEGAASSCNNQIESYTSVLLPNTTNLWKVSGGAIVGSNTDETVKINWNKEGEGKVMLTKTSTLSTCVANSEFTVEVKPTPNAEVYGSMSPCFGNEYNYYTSHSEGTSNTWIFSSGSTGPIVTTDDSVKIVWGKVGNNYIKIERTNTNGCKDTLTVFLNVFSAPDKPTINQESDKLVSSASNEKHEWYLNGNLISGENTYRLIPQANGFYTCITISKQGCRSELSSAFEYNGTSVGESKEMKIDIYPNPANETISLAIPNELILTKVEIINSLGEIVMMTDYPQNILNVKGLSNGVYSIRFYSNESIISINHLTILR